MIESEEIEMEQNEASQIIKACVRNILGQPRVEVATKFVEFRNAVESKRCRRKISAYPLCCLRHIFLRNLQSVCYYRP